MKNKFGIVILILLMILFECLFFRLLSSSHIYEPIMIFLIIFNTIFIGFFLLKNKTGIEKKINIVIYFSYIIRLILLLLDVYTNIKFFSGSDTENFYNAAIGKIVFNHNYVKQLKFLFSILGNTRIVGQYFNTFLSLFTMIIMKKTLFCILNNKKNILFIMFLFSMAPANILLSASLLRETTMIFFNTLSIYFFINWYQQGKLSFFVLSCLLVFFSAWLHSGMLVAIIGYGIAYIIYNPKIKKITFHKKTFYYLIILFAIILLLYKSFGSSVTEYFDKINELEDITDRTVVGTTDYLTNFDGITSLPLLLLITPIRVFYFLFSPMIWSCRSIGTVSVFLFSSTIYLFLVYNIFYKKELKEYSILKKLLIIIIAFICLVYSWGTSNTGTAMRHREKIYPYLIVLYALGRRSNNEKKEY